MCLTWGNCLFPLEEGWAWTGLDGITHPPPTSERPCRLNPTLYTHLLKLLPCSVFWHPSWGPVDSELEPALSSGLEKGKDGWTGWTMFDTICRMFGFQCARSAISLSHCAGARWRMWW